MNRSRKLGVAVAAVSALGLTACGGGSGGGGSSQSAEGTLTVAFDADAAPTGYDPLLYSQGQFTFFGSMYDALFETDTDGVSQPSLATGYTNSADNLQTTLTLRDDVTFTDGSSLDADLVKANLDRRTDTDLTAYGAFASGGASEITDVTVTDPQTVVITWAAPQATPENSLVDTAGAIVGKDGVDDPTSLETTPDGSGAYTLDSGASTRASSYTVTKEADNWDAGSWSYDTIVFKVITDAQALANAVVSGQADVATVLDPSTIDLVESQQKTVSVGGTIVGFPVTDKTGAINPAFGDVRVRQALLYATDRQSLVDDLHPGAKATSQLFPSTAEGYDETLNTEYGYDPEKAEQLLSEAGYADGLEVNLTVLGQPDEDAVAIQAQWAQVGITLNFITATSTDQAFAAVSTDPILFGPFAVGANPAGFIAGVVVGGFMNLQQAQDPDISAALGASLGSTGATQEQALTQLNTLLTERGWYVPVYEDFTYAGYNADSVQAPQFAGTNNYLVLSAIQPA